MLKYFAYFFFLILTLIFTSPTFAKTNSFVSIVNPIRGEEFWDLKGQTPQDSVLGQIEILKKFNIPATFLLRFDALGDKNITEKLGTFEKGIFLEITPSLTKMVGVTYHPSENWHSAGSAFLTGYGIGEREKLIDGAFEKFKEVFGSYPTSVGAWWIDSHSLQYMQSKYKITGALIVSDQYTTDNYQIWGQYFGTPYYPQKRNALHPAQSLENKLDVVITQWAPRDPVNAYGSGVEESTFSVQPNDYIDFHSLDINYFSKLVDIYTKAEFNKFNHLVVGLENTYSWNKYASEYEKQIENLVIKAKSGQIEISSLKDFSNWYKLNFPTLSPTQIIISDDPLGSFKKAVWFMNPYYRVGYFINSDGSVFRDIRQYIDGSEELCLLKRCDSVNFATSATRVLDDVSFGHKYILDEGKVSDFKVEKKGDNYTLTYKNEAGNLRTVEFLNRDIRIDGKVYSVDSLILEATKNNQETTKSKINLEKGSFKWDFFSSTFKIIKFLIFLILAAFIPGYLLTRKIIGTQLSLKIISISIISGLVISTLLFYLLSQLNFKLGMFIFLFVNILLVFKFRKVFRKFSISFSKFNILVAALIGAGTIFQQLPSFKNGLQFLYGIGFWGPNTHDGIWHLSLINQLMKDVPPQNPIFAGETLKNYHYFFDLLVALTSYLTAIPVMDLLFRFYPIIFSLILGIGTFYLVKQIIGKENKKAILFSIYLVYFAGSFGWIVEYIKQKHLGGESAFWANQSISFNLNPPFAVSLLIVIAFFLILPFLKSKSSILILTLLAGSLISFKAYGAVLILATLLTLGILKRNIPYLITFATSLLLSLILFLSNFKLGQQLILFSPFWFIHSMIDSPDRVGWTRLTLARVAGQEGGNWFKFISAEAISLFLFIVGNLGTRFFALLTLFKLKTIFRNTFYLSLFIFSLLSLLIPILFIQAGNPWNTIQFLYYFLYISAVFAGIVLAKMPLLLVIPFLIITPINSWATANGYLSYQPHGLIMSKELEALNFLKSQKEGTVLTYPYSQNLRQKISEPWPLFVYDSTAYVSALSGKATFIEDEPQNQILLTDYKKRVVASKDFFLTGVPAAERFLEVNVIRYIYIPKMVNVRLDESSGLVSNIFENEEVVIYQYKK